MTIDWRAVVPTTHAGESGAAYWRTVESGASRVRVVEYSPGYTGDHWCERGHKAFCLEGGCRVDYVDGATESIEAGQSWCAPDGAPGHRIVTLSGAKLFLVD